jgi:hypothetical protein
MRPSQLLSAALICASIHASPLSITTRTDTDSNSKANRCTEPGIFLTNKSPSAASYWFYNNYWNGDGTAGPNYDNASPKIDLAPGESQMVPLSLAFKGRVQRGGYLPCTFVEFQLQDTTSPYADHKAHGDVSVQQGYDGSATIMGTDGTNLKGGFDWDVYEGAPDSAFRMRADGKRVIDGTVGMQFIFPSPLPHLISSA